MDDSSNNGSPKLKIVKIIAMICGRKFNSRQLTVGGKHGPLPVP